MQAQMVQLQRYKENVHAQKDALSHHEINRTFVRAMAVNKTLFASKEDTDTTIGDINELVNNAKEMTELLGQPIDTGPDVTDEDLEEEFMETLRTHDTAAEEELPQRPAVASSMTTPPVTVVSRQLVLPAAMA